MKVGLFPRPELMVMKMHLKFQDHNAYLKLQLAANLKQSLCFTSKSSGTLRNGKDCSIIVTFKMDRFSSIELMLMLMFKKLM